MQPFEKGWNVLPGGGSDETSQTQGVATNVGCAFDGFAACKSKVAFSDEQVGLPLGLVSKVGLGLAHGGVVGYFVRGW